MFTDNQINQVINFITTQSVDRVPLVVGIDGLTGAGKSTLVRQISRVLDEVLVVELDDFYRPISDDKICKIPATQIYECYFDSKMFRDLVLYPLIHGLPSRYRRYNWCTNKQAEWIDLTPARFVIVDGVFSTLPELRSLYNVTVFVNTDRDIRISRLQKRFYKDMSWLDGWIDAENLYMENIQPIQYVDLVLDGSNIE